MKRIATISIGIGNIEIGNTSILATFNKDLGRKCFGFTKDGRGHNSQHQEVGVCGNKWQRKCGIICA